MALAPEGGQFVDGNPVGGTIVSAAYMNSVLGEIKSLLALEGVPLQESGALPSDHQQLADMFAAAWVRIRGAGTYPAAASPNAVLIDPVALASGQWPFRLWQDGAWSVPPSPLPLGQPAPGEPAPTPESGITEVTDVVHGQRGGGDLHSLATSTRAGFLSAAGYQTLVALSEQKATSASSNWQSVSARSVVSFAHGLARLPSSVAVWFRDSAAAPPRLVQTFFTPQQRFCGASVISTTVDELILRTGDRVWAGYTLQGYAEFSAGEYLIKAIAHGS